MVARGGIAIIRKTNGNLRRFILHFAAGVVLSVIAIELLPYIVKNHQPVQVVIGFFSDASSPQG